MDSQHQAELRKVLESQRQKLTEEIQRKKRELRAEKTKFPESEGGRLGGLESDGIAESVQDEIDISLVQSKTDMLHKIEDALGRLEKGRYGNCSECGGEISERRLQALPFAIRCKSCEESFEKDSTPLKTQRRGVVPSFFTYD